MNALKRYRLALTIPGIARVMAAAFVCRLLAGMISLSLLLVAKRASGSYGNAGTVVGAYAIALAFTSPLWGRAADRWGPRTALAMATSLQSLSFALFVAVAATQAWPPLLVGTAFLAGACTPPAAAISNTVFMTTVVDEQLRRTLFALSGLLTEAVFVVGPLIVAGIVALVAPLYAVVTTAVISAAGVWWLRGAAAVRVVDRERPSLATRLMLHQSPQQLHILLVAVAAAFALGGLQVAIVARAEGLHASAGTFLAAMAVGGAVGSFLYGGSNLRGALPSQLAAMLALYGGFVLTMGLELGTVASLLVLFLVGSVNGPADAVEMLLVGSYSPPGTQSQSFAVLVAANWVGFAAGSAMGGILVQHYSVGLGVLVAGLAALTAAGSFAVPSIRARGRVPQESSAEG